MDSTIAKPYKITVWYRYATRTEIEKDFDVLTIIEKSAQDAVNKSANHFKSLKAIPFSFECDGKKYTPNNFNKSKITEWLKSK